MNPSDPLWSDLRETQDEARQSAGYLSRARNLRAARPPSTARKRWRWWLAVAAAPALGGALGAALVSHRTAPDELTFSMGGEAGQVGSWIASPETGTLALQFSDGTLFQLSAGSRARVSATDANGARIVVERGSAKVAVVHRPDSRWLVDVGPFEVTVVGTRFDVSWDANEEVFRLKLEEGSVFVSGACLSSPRPVVQGHALRVSCTRDREEILETRGDAAQASDAGADDLASREAGPGDLPPAGASGNAGLLPATQTEASRHSVPPGSASADTPAEGAHVEEGVLRSRSWHDLMSAGRFREALALVEQSGFDDTCRRAPGPDLLELGDAARLAGDATRARRAYLAARGKLKGGGRSAYSLGLTAFDQDRDFALAGRWFGVYLAEQPGGDLRREAEGRLMEAWLRAGDREAARKVAAQYLREYPSGTQAPLARQIVAP